MISAHCSHQLSCKPALGPTLEIERFHWRGIVLCRGKRPHHIILISWHLGSQSLLVYRHWYFRSSNIWSDWLKFHIGPIWVGTTSAHPDLTHWPPWKGRWARCRIKTQYLNQDGLWILNLMVSYLLHIKERKNFFIVVLNAGWKNPWIFYQHLTNSFVFYTNLRKATCDNVLKFRSSRHTVKNYTTKSLEFFY